MIKLREQNKGIGSSFLTRVFEVLRLSPPDSLLSPHQKYRETSDLE